MLTIQLTTGQYVDLYPLGSGEMVSCLWQDGSGAVQVHRSVATQWVATSRVVVSEAPLEALSEGEDLTQALLPGFVGQALKAEAEEAREGARLWDSDTWFDHAESELTNPWGW